MKKANKKPSRKIVNANFGVKGPWKVVGGTLKRSKGNPGRVENLFSMVAEKIPYSFLDEVRTTVTDLGYDSQGVYVAHDSMGWPRYIGRGEVFSRLKERKRQRTAELHYFSFYFIANKKHTREIETLMIRTAGSLLSFNDKKRRLDQMTGRVDDYEPGTDFIERQSKKGRPTPLDPI
ncbi:hypothetical protein [Bradyrhizobium sp. 131]|uniref:hypothetical protein n=1 Tax=Bradyrhizobium sp. 131 TaxID=2782609 RepID=UPI001FFF86FD|nr:hypothetical protein [Bradyrhizobium sp. 131]UPK17589.1 hypothetical protein IVA73_26370 [Bradyrhizobium sp. 131]